MLLSGNQSICKLRAAYGHPSYMLSIGVFLLLALSLSGCDRTYVKSNLGVKGAPDWVNQGTQAVSDKRGRLIQGVGMATAMGDVALQKSVADNRARTEVARVLATYVDETIEDFTQVQDQQLDTNIKREIRTYTRQALSGSRILGHWKDKKTGEIYAFAVLDLDHVKKHLEAATKLGAAFKEYYDQQSNIGFDRFVEERKP